MSSLSIRSLPKEIDQALRKEAQAKKTTKTNIVLQALKERFHLGEREIRKRKLRNFFGGMTQSQYETFKIGTKPFSEIDQDLWK